MEEALTLGPGCLDNVVDDLIQILMSEDHGLRGDTTCVLGKIGHASAIPVLKPLLNDPGPEIAEIVREAIEEILFKQRMN